MIRCLLAFFAFGLALPACSDAGGNGLPDAASEDADGGLPPADEMDAGGDAEEPGVDADGGGDEPAADGVDGGMDAGGDDPSDGGGDQGEDGGGDEGGDEGEPEFFTVLTINLKHPITGLAEADERLQIVADGINARQPDVVALQEVIRDGEDPSFAEKLGALTGYHWFWEFAYTVPLLFDEGLGILSRWPIAWSESADLPHLDLVMFTRKVLGVGIDSHHGEIRFFCTHMTTDSDESVKADQALAVYQFMASHPSALPGFMAGDLNAEPDTLAMRFFRGEAVYEGVTADLIDSWPAANPGQDGFTMESDNPTRRIDYIYVAPGSGHTARVDSCELMFTEPVGDLYASDHLGVLCRFEMP